MCGRTACTLASDEISRASTYRDRGGHRRRPQWRDGDSDKYRPSYNKSPQSHSPVLLSRKHFDKEAPVDECVLAAMRWGLVPAWFRENDPNKMQYSTSNCRSESLLEKKSYKCQVAQSSGFKGDTLAQGEEEEKDSEWTGWRLLTIAGLFDSWTPPCGGETLYTYTVITVNASPNLQSIHDRMPAVLDGEEEVRRWLDYGEVRSLDALKLLQSKDTLTFHPVSSFVNNSRNNSPECLQPVELGGKKESRPSASSKMMMSWLKSATPGKRKAPEEDTKDNNPLRGEKDKHGQPSKETGPLQKWLLKSETSKKARDS
ncbi:hypothetical protein JZ751_017797 [Albula glossodonta]|uniref:Abasic site processing protein HMCES n=1 Tax=Albula glossodonta TaxID=121402 RepID=A0A8T2PPF7_9TELE|nr:hypothetical protein JZ751_017797 [Albula glossodonta]